jgi:hypothetical protein
MVLTVVLEIQADLADQVVVLAALILLELLALALNPHKILAFLA